MKKKFICKIESDGKECDGKIIVTEGKLELKLELIDEPKGIDTIGTELVEPKEETLKDAVTYGIGIEQDGKTIPPKEFYREETCEHEVKNTDCICKHCGACMIKDCDENETTCSYIADKKEETLEEKLDAYFVVTKTRDSVIKITKKHYQDHPEELKKDIDYSCRVDSGYWSVFKTGIPFAAEEMLNEFNLMKEERKGLVSIDKVLEVFDEAKVICASSTGSNSVWTNPDMLWIRRAIEGMKNGDYLKSDTKWYIKDKIPYSEDV